MKHTATVSIIVSLACAPFAVHAKRPHPDPIYPITNVTCECDWSVDPATCTVSWDDVDAPTYGVDVEFEAEWVMDGVEMSSSAELDLDDNWICDGTRCSATGDFALPEFAEGAEIKFVGKVKGFDVGADGETSRDFVKATGACNLPPL